MSTSIGETIIDVVTDFEITNPLYPKHLQIGKPMLMRLQEEWDWLFDKEKTETHLKSGDTFIGLKIQIKEDMYGFAVI